MNKPVKTFRFLWLAIAPGYISMLAAPNGYADSTIFRGSRWIVNCAKDTAASAQPMRISVMGRALANRCSELKVFYKRTPRSAPQVFSVKGSGALRPALPGGEFGGTFYTTGYWDCTLGFIQNTAITRLDIRLDPAKRRWLRLRGVSSNLSSFKAPNFTLRFPPAATTAVRALVRYRLVASRDFCVDIGRQAQHEGFRLVRIASNYLSPEVHDSDKAVYFDANAAAICADLNNQSGFVFTAPGVLGSMLSLLHTDMHPRNTPTLSILMTSPPPAQIIPQGWVTGSVDPNDDNVDLWANWELAQQSYLAGQVIGTFAYALIATPAGGNQCLGAP